MLRNIPFIEFYQIASYGAALNDDIQFPECSVPENLVDSLLHQMVTVLSNGDGRPCTSVGINVCFVPLPAVSVGVRNPPVSNSSLE